jgi:hypothetical protein
MYTLLESCKISYYHLLWERSVEMLISQYTDVVVINTADYQRQVNKDDIQN